MNDDLIGRQATSDMALDRAIAHAEEVYNESLYALQDALDFQDYEDAEKYQKCADEHKQIAEWLSELKEKRKQPEIIRCKDCRHWKDSDGVFRRGIDAESKCPLNLHEVYEGTFFCGMAKRKGE